jgi:hypothetical protein
MELICVIRNTNTKNPNHKGGEPIIELVAGPNFDQQNNLFLHKAKDTGFVFIHNKDTHDIKFWFEDLQDGDKPLAVINVWHLGKAEVFVFLDEARQEINIKVISP